VTAFPLDPAIAGMVASTESLPNLWPQRFVDVRLAAAAACIFVGLLAMSAAFYEASPEQASYVRHLAYSEDVVKPPRRVTADEHGPRPSAGDS
jgi:hypothetical protein